MSTKFGGAGRRTRIARWNIEPGQRGWVCVGVNAVIAAVTSYGRICVPAHGVTQRHITPVMHDVSYQSITALTIPN